MKARIEKVHIPGYPAPFRALVMEGNGFRVVRKWGKEIYRESLN